MTSSVQEFKGLPRELCFKIFEHAIEQDPKIITDLFKLSKTNRLLHDWLLHYPDEARWAIIRGGKKALSFQKLKNIASQRERFEDPKNIAAYLKNLEMEYLAIDNTEMNMDDKRRQFLKILEVITEIEPYIKEEDRENRIRVEFIQISCRFQIYFEDQREQIINESYQKINALDFNYEENLSSLIVLNHQKYEQFFFQKEKFSEAELKIISLLNQNELEENPNPEILNRMFEEYSKIPLDLIETRSRILDIFSNK